MLRNLFSAAALVAVFSVVAPAFADEPGVPASKPIEGKYTIERNTFLIGNSFRLFTWHDGKNYISGSLNYSSYRMNYQLPLVQASDAPNHFTAEGTGATSQCQFELKFDLYTFQDKAYLGIYAPESADCGTNSYNWDRFEEPFKLYVPPPPPTKPTCACKEVLSSDNQVLCTLEQVSHAVVGSCQPDNCNALIKEAGGACIAP